MTQLDANQQAFLALVRAGLWERSAQLSQYGEIDWGAVYRQAEEQAVLGLVAAGLEHVSDVVLPKEEVLVFVGGVLPLEQRNADMNRFVGEMAGKLRDLGITPVLVKGSAVALCYERPLWRSCGDIDFFFSKSDFRKAVDALTTLSSKVFQDARFSKSYGLIIDGWVVELHGTLRCGLSSKLVKETDRVQSEVFDGGDVRMWMNGNMPVLLPGVNSDLFLLFTHFVRHFYQNDFVLRQVCDWCRFLWTYRGDLDVDLLAERLRRTNLMGEWKSFAALVVDYLGMPVEAMPFYNDEKKWHVKGERIMAFAFSGSGKSKVKATCAIAKIFPWNTFLFSPSIFFYLNWQKIKERVLNR